MQRTEREKRNQVYSYLTAKEAQTVGLNSRIENYPINVRVLGGDKATLVEDYPRCSNDTEQTFREGHHLSEITVLQNGGMRYVYGLPAYNLVHREVTFSVDGNGADEDDNTISYVPMVDNSINNAKGDDHYFDAEEIPPYVHSLMLTAVLSPDYVDRTGDGITDDDVGTAIKLNYSKLGGENTNYQWRVPFNQDEGNYNRGYNTLEGDDKASYIYGQKEIWYLHSIESRTMIAEFKLDNNLARTDGFATLGEDGGRVTNNLLKYRRLERIDLYAKADIIANAANAVPIKSVNFEYEDDTTDELCRNINNASESNIDNKNRGKSTLKKLYFTYGNSQRGQLNAYEFKYANVNPDYNIGQYDRWGCFKIHPNESANGVNMNNPTPNPNYPVAADFPSKKDFPYCLQEKMLTDQYVQAWNLEEITLPSGGKIKVEYESDDYAYVQNKRAGQMIFIDGFTDDVDNKDDGITLDYDNETTSFLFETTSTAKKINRSDIRRWLVFKPVEAVSSDQEAREKYFEGVDQIYFKFKVRLDDDEDHFEYVSGYFKPEYIDTDNDGEKDAVDVKRRSDGKIAVKIDLIDISDRKFVHPVSKAAYQTMKVNLPEITYPGYKQEERQGLEGFANELRNFFKGFEQNAMLNSWGRKVDLNKSWIRLNNPTYSKLGGGSRVKELRISDEWVDPATNNMNYTSEYGQKYTYTKDVDGIGTISSGVASYEPMLGNEENSLRVPMLYDEQFLVAPSNRFYTELPVGEALYPAPVVGYSEVKVESIDYPGSNPKPVGYSVNQFYTAKDFPVRTDYTSKEPYRLRTNPLFKILNLDIKDFVSVSQGFVVEVNDMHGKPKSEATYNAYGSLLSSSEYYYKVDKTDENEEEITDQELHLNNKVNIVHEDRSITEANMGLDVDVWQDMQEEFTQSKTEGIALNSDGFLAFIFPAIAIIPLPVFNRTRNRFRTAVTTKFVKRFGILDRVVVTENTSRLETKNLLYDAETGDVLLTRTQNEFNDAMYNFNYPAHWSYKGMKQAAHNIGGYFEDVSIGANGLLPINYIDGGFFNEGDELLVTNPAESSMEEDVSGKYFVVQADGSTGLNPNLVLLNVDGDPHPQSMTSDEEVNIKVIRSGRRNLASTSMGSISSRQEPTTGTLAMSNYQIDISTSKEIYQASAAQFKDSWQMLCEYEEDDCDASSFVSEKINPYVKAVKGNWRPSETYVFYSDRTDNARSGGDFNSTDLRTDGDIVSFIPYWTYNGTTWSNSTDDAWTLANRVNLFDQRGNQLESQDAIDVYSSAYYGYNDTRAVAIAANAARSEIINDNFEDYFFENEDNAGRSKRNITFVDEDNPMGDVTTAAAHTGRYALVLDPNEQKTVRTGVECTAPLSTLDGYSINSNGQAMSACEACLPRLSLMPNKEYAVQLWVAKPNSIRYGTPATSVGISINFDTHDIPITFEPNGAIIDGWQRIEGRFTVPATATQVVMQLTNNNTSEQVYIDDFRIHPWRANMKSYVYDPFSMRLWAELDENNYANYYEYDDEGLLVRVKRETEKGIVTIQESRTILKSNNTIPTN